MPLLSLLGYDLPDCDIKILSQLALYKFQSVERVISHNSLCNNVLYANIALQIRKCKMSKGVVRVESLGECVGIFSVEHHILNGYMC